MSWSAPDGSGGWSRPWVWDPTEEGDRAHLAGGAGRPDWFYDAARTGGILTDIASHQIDQFLWFTGSDSAEVVSSTVANYTHPDSPAMQDFGEATLRSDHAHGYVRVDWYTPQGLPTWGDGRLVILGTEGYLELRKYVDIAGRPGRDHLFVVDGNATEYVDCSDVELELLPGPGARRRPPHRDRLPAGAHLRGDATRPAGPARRDHQRFRPMTARVRGRASRAPRTACGSASSAAAASATPMPGPTLANRRVELVGVVDVIPERAETYARDYATTAYPRVAELADQQPDLVSVATPPGSHVGPTLELLQHGRRCCWRSRPPPTWWISTP